MSMFEHRFGVYLSMLMVLPSRLKVTGSWAEAHPEALPANHISTASLIKAINLPDEALPI